MPLLYIQLLQQVKLLARTLKQLGVEHNDCVGIALPNVPEMAVSFLGVSAIAVSVPISLAYRETECKNLFSDLSIKVLITNQNNQTPAYLSYCE